MLNFIPAKIRKKIYQTLAALNAFVGPVLGFMFLYGYIDGMLQQQILGIAASIMSSLGFLLAARNTDTGMVYVEDPEKDAEIAEAAKKESAN